jgi:hypothetical protein
LDQNIYDDLEREADHKEVSLNVLVNQILRRYNSWYKYEEKIGVMPVPKEVLSYIMGRATSIAEQNGTKEIEPHQDRVIEEAALRAFYTLKDSVLLMRRDYNLWTVLAVLQEYMKVSNIASDHRIDDGNRHVFVVQHDLGENWSIFTKELFNHIFEDLANTRADVNMTSKSVIAKVALDDENS